MDTKKWAEEQFGQVHLGDARRTKRAVQVAAALAGRPDDSLPAALPNWAELKAAYRLLHCPKVTHDMLILPHCQATRAALDQPGDYVLLEDTTELDFTAHRATTGLGQIGNQRGRGLLVHSTLVLRLEDWDETQRPRLSVVGLLGQETWTRKGPPHKGREKWRQRLARPRESQRWGRVLAQGTPPAPGAHWTYIADAEGDIYELFDGERLPQGCDFVIRMARERACAQPELGGILQALERAAALGLAQVQLRARPGQAARTARLTLRATHIVPRPPYRPGHKLAPVGLWLVAAREESAPAGVEPLNWVLLTSYDVPDEAACRRVVTRYSCRWQVEEYHKCLKSGCIVEERQMGSIMSLLALLGFYALIALQLLRMKWQERETPEAPVPEDLRAPEVESVLEAVVGRPAKGWTLHELLRAVARLGGFLGRKGDGEPGIKTLWRGWIRLMDLTLGYQLAHENNVTPP